RVGNPPGAAGVLARLERARLRSRDRSARARLLGDCAGNAVPRRRLVSQTRDHRDRLPVRSVLVPRRRARALARPELSQLRRRRAARAPRVATPCARTQTTAARQNLGSRGSGFTGTPFGWVGLGSGEPRLTEASRAPRPLTIGSQRLQGL